MQDIPDIELATVYYQDASLKIAAIIALVMNSKKKAPIGIVTARFQAKRPGTTLYSISCWWTDWGTILFYFSILPGVLLVLQWGL